MMNEDLFHETLVIRPAFGDLVGRVCEPGTDADLVPLEDVRAGLDEWGLDRFGALLLANRVVDTYEDGFALAVEIRAEWLARDRRPMTMYQVLEPEERRRVERAFAEASAADQPWWKRLRERVARAIVADEETSRRMDEAELRAEGRIP